MLAPGGRMVGSTLAVGRWSADDLGPFAPTDVAFAVRAGHGWSLRPEPDGEAEVVLWAARPRVTTPTNAAGRAR